MLKLRVKEILKEKGISQKEIAEKMNITEVGFSKTIGENGNPSLKKIEELADILNVPISELFEQPKKDYINCPNCGVKLNLEKGE